MPMPTLRSTLMTTLLFTAACGQPPAVARLDVSLKTPKKPGEAYSLVRAASADDQITSIAVSDNYLFFATSWKGVYRLPKYGGAIDPVEEDADAIASVAASRDTVFWNRTTFGGGDIAHTQLKKRAAAGGASSVLLDGEFSLPGANLNASLSVVSDALYFTRQSTGGTAPIEFARLSLPGGGLTTLLSVPYPLVDPDALPRAWVVQGDHFYYTLRGAGGTKLLEAKPDGSGATQLAAGASLLGTYLGADADSLYTDGKVGAYEGLVAAAKADGALTPLIKGGAASPTAFTSTLGVDKENVYYMTVDSAAGWQVQAVPKAGGTPTVIGLGSQFDLGIDQMAQDDNNLYLLHNWHEILLLPKKPGDPKGL